MRDDPLVLPVGRSGVISSRDLLMPDVEAIELVREVAEVIRRRATTVVTSISTAMLSAIPALAAIEPELRRGIEGDVEAALELLSNPLVPAVAYCSADSVSLGATFARLGFPRRWLNELYRLGANIYFEVMLAELTTRAASRELLGESLRYLWPRYTEWADESVEQTLRTYEEQTIEERDRASVRQRVLVSEVLTGIRDADEERFSRQLGHNLRLTQLAFVLWFDTDAPREDRIERARAVLIDVSRSLGAPRPLVLPAGSTQVWAWAAIPGSTSLAALSDPTAALQRIGGRLAVGSPQGGTNAFQRTHREAQQGRRVARDLMAADTVIHYRDVAALALVAADLSMARDFAQEELGGLAENSDECRLLRATLAVLFSEQLSVTRTAATMHTHRNTILNRVHTAEIRLGRPVHDRRMELELALRLFDGFHRSVSAGDSIS
jgi:DNA-binding PucR family transcriptional regulator